uniref:Uncharacterized protein n=1 Tax=Cyprinus carpio carpio TaxID=630221 RepID=A0A9J7Y540_CYPCA
ESEEEEEKGVSVSSPALCSVSPPAPCLERGGGRHNSTVTTGNGREQQTEVISKPRGCADDSLCVRLQGSPPPKLLSAAPYVSCWLFLLLVSLFVANSPHPEHQEKSSSTKRGDAPSATGEEKFPGIPQELYRDCTGPPDPAGSRALGHHRSQQDLVPIVGGERWLLSNTIHDVAATLLYLSTIGIMIYKTQKNSYCNLDVYKHHCLYKVYLTASIFACLTASVYLLSAIYCSYRKCRGEQTVI